MTTTIIVTFCVLLLIAYLFDLTSSKTKIPSVILLILLGWGLKQLTVFIGIKIPDFSPTLPVIGTLGLILIVLEGSLELELNKSKIGVITKTFLGSFISLVLSALLLAYLFHYFGLYSLKMSLINAIPFCIISSAIAIPSVGSLSPSAKEFVIYESSLSDILGVIFFNFIVVNQVITADSFINFGMQLGLITVISFFATIALSLLLSQIDHHIKFVPIVLLVILIYSVSKIYHLPALVFILLFGLFIGNSHQLSRFKWIERFHPEELQKEVKKFKELIIEATFLVRASFFLLFGYLLETAEILNPNTIFLALLIILIIVVFRAIQLKLSGIPLSPLLFVAPRGLITILLFLSIAPEQSLFFVNKSLVIQVIAISALMMMFGLMTATREELKADINGKKEEEKKVEEKKVEEEIPTAT